MSPEYRLKLIELLEHARTAKFGVEVLTTEVDFDRLRNHLYAIKREDDRYDNLIIAQGRRTPHTFWIMKNHEES